MAITLFETKKGEVPNLVEKINLLDIMTDSELSQRVSIARTSMGVEPGKERTILRKAVKWKGKKLGSIDQYRSEDEFVDAAMRAGMSAEQARALWKIAHDSKKLAQLPDEIKRGLVVVQRGGRTYVMSKAAYLKLAKKLKLAGKEGLLANIFVEELTPKSVVVSNRPGKGAYHLPADEFANADYNALETAQIPGIMVKA